MAPRDLALWAVWVRTRPVRTDRKDETDGWTSERTTVVGAPPVDDSPGRQDDRLITPNRVIERSARPRTSGSADERGGARNERQAGELWRAWTMREVRTPV
jgi:hypothetical protein